MPVLTYYLYTNKYRVPIRTIEAWPLNWPEQKDQLLEVATEIYMSRDGQTTSEISLELHLPGRTVMAGRTAPSKQHREQPQRYVKKGTYSGQRIRPRRIPELRCVLIYNPHLNTVEVKSPSFGPSSNMQEIRLEHRNVDRGLEYAAPPLISRMEMNTAGDPKALLSSQAAAGDPHASYSRSPRPVYGDLESEEDQEKDPYARVLVMPYAERGKRVFEEDKFLKEEQ